MGSRRFEITETAGSVKGFYVVVDRETGVTFTLNENGILALEGREPKSGKTVEVTMESKALLEADEIMVQKGDIDKLKKAY